VVGKAVLALAGAALISSKTARSAPAMITTLRRITVVSL
jgi:hypothetical protein